MIDVEGRLETGGLSAFGGTRGAGGHYRPHGLIRRALAAPWRKPAAPLTRRPSPAKMGAGFFGPFGALVFEAPPHDRPMTPAPRGGILRIAPGQTSLKTKDLVQTRTTPDGL
jgi:hypothetical protein